MTKKYSISVVGKDLFPQRMHLEKEIGEVFYSKREQKKGSEVLFQLHQGNITLKDFDDRLGY